jgi:hypothetical protein
MLVLDIVKTPFSFTRQRYFAAILCNISSIVVIILAFAVYAAWNLIKFNISSSLSTLVNWSYVL